MLLIVSALVLLPMHLENWHECGFQLHPRVQRVAQVKRLRRHKGDAAELGPWLTLNPHPSNLYVHPEVVSS